MNARQLNSEMHIKGVMEQQEKQTFQSTDTNRLSSLLC